MKEPKKESASLEMFSLSFPSFLSEFEFDLDPDPDSLFELIKDQISKCRNRREGKEMIERIIKGKGTKG